jgi:hypothetical protein
MTGDIPVFIAIVAITCAVSLWQGARHAARYLKKTFRSQTEFAVPGKAKAASGGAD